VEKHTLSPSELPERGIARQNKQTMLRKGCIGIIIAAAIFSVVLFVLLALASDALVNQLVKLDSQISLKIALNLHGLNQSEKADAQAEIATAYRTAIIESHLTGSPQSRFMVQQLQYAWVRSTWTEDDTRDFLGHVRAFNAQTDSPVPPVSDTPTLSPHPRPVTEPTAVPTS